MVALLSSFHLLFVGQWTDREDELLTTLIAEIGIGSNSWNMIGERFAKRSGKQCRERWYNHLDPNVAKGDWTQEVRCFHSYFSYSSIDFIKL
jgi:hypothetical protein